MRREVLLVTAIAAFVAHRQATATTCTVTPTSCHATGGTIKVEDCGAAGNGSDDTACWQAALDAAKPASGTPFFGTVEGKSGAVYGIYGTLRVTGAFGGEIKGNGALFQWHGPSPPATDAMWLIEDAQGLKISNVKVESGFAWETPLFAGIEFANANSGLATSKSNTVDQVFIWGGPAGVTYGIRFNRGHGHETDPAYDHDNDQCTIMNTTIYDVNRAAISIEHSQSHQHRLYAVNAYGAAGNESVCSPEVGDPATTVCGASFVRLLGGGFSSIGGFRWNFKNAEFYLVGWNDPITIIDTNSEYCSRFLKSPGGSAWFPFPVHVYGGRFATDHMDCDGHVIDWRRGGPVQVRGMEIECPYSSTLGFNQCDLPAYFSSCSAGNPKPMFYLAPAARSYPTSSSTFESDFDIADNLFWGVTATDAGGAKGSSQWDTVKVDVQSGASPPITARVVSHGNLCLDSSGRMTTCQGIAAGMDSFQGIPYAQLSALAVLDGHTTFCSDCAAHTSPCAGSGTGTMALRQNGTWDCGGGVLQSSDATVTYDSEWDTAAEINGRTTDDDFATLTGAQSLFNKNLTSTSNTFPQTAEVIFTTASAVTTSRYCALNNAIACSTSSESAVSIGIAAAQVKGLRCKASAAPGGASKNWTFKLWKNGQATTFSNCTISNATTSCSDTSTSVQVSEGDTVSLQFVATTGGNVPASATVFCSLGVSPMVAAQ